MTTRKREISLEGSPVGSGIAIGRALFLDPTAWETLEQSILPEALPDEINYYRQALEACQRDLTKLHRQLEEERAIEGAAIITSQLQLLSDPLLTQQVEAQMIASHKSAATVFARCVREYEQRFSEIPDPFFRERVADLQDLADRVLTHLAKRERHSLAEVDEEVIVLAERISPSEAAEADRRSVHGFVTTTGGVASHTAIVAKAKGIPYVADIDLKQINKAGIRDVIVDGRAGRVIFNPSAKTLKHYQSLQNDLRAAARQLEAACSLPAVTLDGTQVSLAGNLEHPSEIELLHEYGADGIGLYRSEYLMLAKRKLPSEEQQFRMYRDIVERMEGRPVVIRTFDIGGDKQIHGKGNALGCRAIRLFLKEPEAFKAQLRAIVRAAAYGPVQMLFPMISGLTELRACKALVNESIQELRVRGIKVPDSIPIGCMIEVPSAALVSDLIAKECDFLSIGTNDLIQYILAVDRESFSSHHLYRPTAPAIIRVLRMIVTAANAAKCPVTVCGEVAADPQFTALLIGLGVRRFSVAPRHLPKIRYAIRSCERAEAEKLAEHVLTLSTAYEIQQVLTERLLAHSH